MQESSKKATKSSRIAYLKADIRYAVEGNKRVAARPAFTFFVRYYKQESHVELLRRGFRVFLALVGKPARAWLALGLLFCRCLLLRRRLLHS
jgi:hypothetical protein